MWCRCCWTPPRRSAPTWATAPTWAATTLPPSRPRAAAATGSTESPGRRHRSRRGHLVGYLVGLVCQAVDMQHAHGLAVPETVDEMCRPGGAAVLVYDAQAGILPHVQDRDGLVKRITE